MPKNQSTNEYFNQFSQNLQAELTKQGRDILDRWLDEADKNLKSSLRSLLEVALAEVTETLYAQELSGQSSFSSTKSLAGSLTTLVEALVSKEFSKQNSSTTSAETERSLSYNAQLKDSVSQRQAKLAVQTSSGQRNL